MRGSTAGVVALCVCCLLGLGLLAGAIQSPTTAAGTYEVALPAEDLLSVSEPTGAAGSVDGSTTGGDGASAGLGGATPLGPAAWLVVLGVWAVLVLRLLNAAAVVLTALLLAAVAAAWYLVGFEPSAAGAAASSSATDPLSLLDRLLLLVFVVVYLLTGLALVLPAGGERYRADLGLVDALRRAAGRLAGDDRAASPSTGTDRPPEAEPHRAWWELARAVSVDPRRPPGEVESAATAADLSREPIHDLRRRFERVRYGGRTPTDDDVAAAERVRRELARVDDDRPPDDGGGRGNDGGPSQTGSMGGAGGAGG